MSDWTREHDGILYPVGTVIYDGEIEVLDRRDSPVLTLPLSRANKAKVYTLLASANGYQKMMYDKENRKAAVVPQWPDVDIRSESGKENRKAQQ